MEIKTVDPFEVNVSEFNEREENLNLGELSENIRDGEGVIQPPLVRVRDEDAKVPYEVVVGQRRVLASQGVVDSIPVIVAEWDDKEALKNSITENAEIFQEEVSDGDRAQALKRLWEMIDSRDEINTTKLSNELGVPRTSVNDWIEPIRSEWEGTNVQPVDESDAVRHSGQEDDITEESLSDSLGSRKLSLIRRATGGGEEGEEVAERVLEEGFSTQEVGELKQYLEDGDDLDTAVEKVKETEEDTPQSFTDFSNKQPEPSQVPQEPKASVEDIESPSEVAEEESEATETSFTDQIETIETVTVPLEGELSTEVELPENIYEKSRQYASDFDYDSVEEYLIIGLLPEILESEQGTDLIGQTLQEKISARGY